VVYRWDLDKTYLRTDFDTLRDLLARAVERASEKRTVPGAAALLRELRATEPAGIYILSGSPEQMRRVLEAKLRLDGIQWDGFTLKPSLRNLLRGRFRFLKDQVGFKLGAMLALREQLDAELDEVLFGDDAETDVFTYSLYADVCAGRVPRDTLVEVLRQAAMAPQDVPELLQRVDRLELRDHCRRIFIHLDRISSLDTFEAYGTRVCPFYNYFQPALVLLEMDAIDAAAALRVAADLVIDQAFTADALAASFQELAHRGQVSKRALGALLDALDAVDETGFATATGTLFDLGDLLARQGGQFAAVAPIEQLDYVAMLARERARAHAAKRRVLGRS